MMAVLQPNQIPDLTTSGLFQQQPSRKQYGIVPAHNQVANLTVALLPPKKISNLTVALLQQQPNLESDYGIIAAKPIFQI